MGRYFGTDGVRGEANKNLKVSSVYRIGRYLGNYYAKNGKGKIVIGKDTRLSSSMFENALACGIAESGSDTLLAGYCTTPCLAYLVGSEDFDCGIMISASHNPFYDNGIKIFGTDGLKIRDDMEDPIEDYMDGKFELPVATKEEIGTIEYYPQGVEHYVDWIVKTYPTDLSSYSILLDLCNGGSCFTAPQIFKRLGAKVTIINDDPDGLNINTNCGSTHLESIQKAMKEGQYDIGFAFDGDADRVLAVDPQGEVVDGDKIMYLLAKQLKAEGKLKGNRLVTTVMSNIGLKKALEAAGIEYEIVAVGDKNVVECMRANDYVVGGEQSGHIINSYSALFGDGVKTALNVLEVMAKNNCDINTLSDPVKVYPQLLINVRVKDKTVVLNDEEICAKIEEVAKALGDNGRILVRPSGTEPLIRVMTEAETDELCEQYDNAVIELIKAKGYAA